MHKSAGGAEGLAEDLQTVQTGRSSVIFLLRLIIQRAIRVFCGTSWRGGGWGVGGGRTEETIRDPIMSLRLHALHLNARDQQGESDINELHSHR